MSQAWEHDPRPTIIWMYAITGIHENTGHQWRIWQAINLTYIPRALRRRFLKDWRRRLEKGERFTWQKVQARYPFLENAIRRYFFKPSYYIQNLKKIELEDLDKVVVSTWSKDFSKKITTALLGKFKKAMKARSMLRKKKKKEKQKRKRR